MDSPMKATVPVQFNYQRFLERRREALMVELSEINRQLGMGPRELALCPNCRKQFNKKIDG